MHIMFVCLFVFVSLFDNSNCIFSENHQPGNNLIYSHNCHHHLGCVCICWQIWSHSLWPGIPGAGTGHGFQCLWRFEGIHSDRSQGRQHLQHNCSSHQQCRLRSSHHNRKDKWVCCNYVNYTMTDPVGMAFPSSFLLSLPLIICTHPWRWQLWNMLGRSRLKAEPWEKLRPHPFLHLHHAVSLSHSGKLF